MPFRCDVTLDQVPPGLAFVKVQVEGGLDAQTAPAVAEQVAARIAALKGRPFGLLVDLRAVTACDDAGARVMQGIEVGAAGKGLEAVAHLVKAKALLGVEKAIGTFDDEREARKFASGLR